MSAETVRRYALRILQQVEEGGSLDAAISDAYARLSELHARALLSELVRGSLRWRGRYDHLINRFSRRRAPRDMRLLCLLRLSLHQLIACDGVPAYAAIHQGGELCREMVSERMVGYVNGMLQAVARALAAEPEEAEAALVKLFPDRKRDPAGFLSSYLSHPRWLVERWLVRFGRLGCEALCLHNNGIPPLVFHVLPPAEPQEVAHQLADCGVPTLAGTLHPRALITRGRVDRNRLRELLAGQPRLIVQDEAAQCATAWLAEGLSGRLLDLCAAPGGKTFHLLGFWPPADPIVAMDRRGDRLQALLQTAKRIELRPQTVVLADGRQPPFAAEQFEVVLLDGPCSGTGVARHHPEGRWRLRPEGLQGNRDRLLALGRQAAALLAPGGNLLYVTCSLEPEENEQVVQGLVESGIGLEPDPALAGNVSDRIGRAWLPHLTGTDGFFAARLKKKAAAS